MSISKAGQQAQQFRDRMALDIAVDIDWGGSVGYAPAITEFARLYGDALLKSAATQFERMAETAEAKHVRDGAQLASHMLRSMTSDDSYIRGSNDLVDELRRMADIADAGDKPHWAKLMREAAATIMANA